MSIVNGYEFNNMGRIGTDVTDLTQKNLYNTRFGNYMLSNYSNEVTSDSHINFAVQQPNVMMNASRGVNSNVIDVNSKLLLNVENERPLEKLQLLSRPFLTVPYLGKGAVDTTLESRLLQGEASHDRKSVSTIMDQNFSSKSQYILDENALKNVNDPTRSIEELALNGWTRGGNATREYSN
jgi:hypothetical protein